MNRDILDNYVRRMSYIRTLSSPTISELENAGDYSSKLRENFDRIGDLAAENKRALEDVIFPFTQSDEPLSDEEIAFIRELNESMADEKVADNLDKVVISLINDRLMRDAQSKGDISYLLHELHSRVVVCHTFLTITGRISNNKAISEDFRYRGLEAAQKAMEYLEPDKFDELPDDARYNVLAVTMIYPGFWATQSGIARDEAHHYVEELDRAYNIYENDYYRDACPEYDWEAYRFRVLGQYGVILDSLYRTEISEDDIQVISHRLADQDAMFEEDPKKCSKWCSRQVVELRRYRAMYLNGEFDDEEYSRVMLELYRNRDRDAFDHDNLYVNVYSVVYGSLALTPARIRERNKDLLGQYYNDVCDYVFKMSDNVPLSEMLGLYTPLLFNFIEIPGRTTFEDMVIRSLAAFHPTTYVHSLMVAQISACLCSHLIDAHPEYFIGMLDYRTVDDVKRAREAILNFTYHAGLCHDFGKLPIVDTVYIYGRKLLDFEFDIIRQHPDLGAELMEKHESTRLYADIARGHHRWYDNSKGYPEDYNTNTSQFKTIIDIVACADCMDAATDSIGRSYNTEKNLDDFIEEVIEGAGTRYAPYLPGLFEDPAVRDDMDYILSDGRNLNYRNAYMLLREVRKPQEPV